MLIILITLFTTSAARTTQSLVNIENNSKYRSFLPVHDVSLDFKNSNGHNLVPIYAYPVEYQSDIKFSDIVFPDQYPNENNNAPWNTPTTTQVSKMGDRFEDRESEEKEIGYVKDFTTQKPEIMTIVNVNNYNNYNRPVNNSKNINTQSNNVILNRHNITRNFVQKNQTSTKCSNNTNVNITKNPNISPISSNRDDSSTNQSSIKPYQNPVKNIKNKHIDNSTRTNMFTTEVYNNIMQHNNVNRSDYGTYGTKATQDKPDVSTYGSKATQDNEVTIINVKPDGDGDKWVWSDETTTLIPLGDRAAFAGNNCPTGTTRVNNQCIPED